MRERDLWRSAEDRSFGLSSVFGAGWMWSPTGRDGWGCGKWERGGRERGLESSIRRGVTGQERNVQVGTVRDLFFDGGTRSRGEQRTETGTEGRGEQRVGNRVY